MIWFFAILGIIIISFFIYVFYTKTKIKNKIDYLKSLKSTLDCWELDKYTERIIKTELLCEKNSFEIKYVEINTSYLYSSSHLICYGNIKMVELHERSVMFHNSLVLCITTEEGYPSHTKDYEIEFSHKYLDNAEKLYRLILDIIFINSKVEEDRLINRVFTSYNQIALFDEKVKFLKDNQSIITDITVQFSKDIFSLIESVSKEVFSFGKGCYSLIIGDNISEGLAIQDNIYTGDWFDISENDEEQIKLFVKGLKKRIRPLWKDKETFDSIIYLVVRNSVIKFYSKYYSLNYGDTELTDYCYTLLSIKEDDMFFYKMAYVCYFIDKSGDFWQPTGNIYEKFSKEINDIINEKKLEMKENALFHDTAVDNQCVEQTKHKNIDEQKLEKTLIEQIDNMKGEEFELFIAEYFKKHGYKAVVTTISGDYGVDVIIENELIKIGIQAKRYTDKVTNSAIQEVVAGIKHYNLDKGMVITNNYFTRAAIELAKDNNITLWDRKTLMEKIKE